MSAGAVYTPAVLIVPTGGRIDQATVLSSMRDTSALNVCDPPGGSSTDGGVFVASGGRTPTPPSLVDRMPFLTKYALPPIPSSERIVPGTSGKCGQPKQEGPVEPLPITTKNRLSAMTNVKIRSWNRDMLASPFGSLISRLRSIFPV